jgi:hypothetical protein
LHVRLFRNCNITFQNKPLIFSSFLRSNIKIIQDIWDENSKQFIDCDLLYSKLIDRRNCISEYSKIKKCIPKDYLKFLRNENSFILLLKNEENIKGLFWKVILQFPNNLTCKISVLVSTFCTHCKNVVHAWIEF